MSWPRSEARNDSSADASSASGAASADGVAGGCNLALQLESIARSQPTAALWLYGLEIVLLSKVCDLFPERRALSVRREEVDPCVDPGELDLLDGLRELRERSGDRKGRVRGAERHLIRPIEVLERLDERGADAV